MKDLKKVIAESVVNSRSKHYVRETVNQILGEDISVGQKVAATDDVISGMSGMRGVIKKISDSNPGFATVESENGTQYEMQVSLLIPV